MEIYYNINEYQPHAGGAYVALGFFDGVHTGHRAVIQTCAKESAALPQAAPCVVLTFCKSPAKSLGKPTPPLLSPNPRKARLLKEAGADEILFADFTAVKDLSPAEFVTEILHEKLNAKRVFCGFNYRFGKNGTGDTAVLRELCEAQGISVSVSEPVFCGGEQVSSSLIREKIASGEIARANELLGYRYAIEGRITDGNQVGSAIGFPTVNIPIESELAVPRCGVYASDILIDGERFCGATNIGVHPTVGAKEEPLCETFLLDFEGGDLYEKHAVCELIAFIRPEQRFASIGALTEQIQRDISVIRDQRAAGYNAYTNT